MDTSTSRAVAGRANEFRIGDVFGRSFELFVRRFAPFFGLTVVAYLPSYLLALLQDGPGSDPSPAIAVTALIGGIAWMVCATLASAAVTYGVVQELRGRPFTFAESLAVALRRLIPMIGVAFCFGILVVLGAIFLIIPGLIIACVYYVAPQACLVERTGVFASLSRSATLTKGHRWQIFGIVLVLFVGNMLVSFLLGAVLAGLGTTALALVTNAWQALIGAFGAVLGGVLYFQLRSLKEGFDIDQIASVFD